VRVFVYPKKVPNRWAGESIYANGLKVGRSGAYGQRLGLFGSVSMLGVSGLWMRAFTPLYTPLFPILTSPD